MDPRRQPKLRYAGAGALVLVALGVAFIGQPTTEDRWSRLAPEKEAALVDRQVQIEPGELLATLHDHQFKTMMIDVRDEADYNLFHLAVFTRRARLRGRCRGRLRSSHDVLPAVAA